MSNSIAEISARLNAAGYVWAMINYSDGTFWAVVQPAVKAEYIGDELAYNMGGESHSTPEEALMAASGLQDQVTPGG